MPLLFIDTETTGLGACRLVEFAWAREEGEIYSFRVKPPIPIEPDATALHGITEEMVKDTLPFSESPDRAAIKDLLETSLVVMHNASFDREVMAREGVDIKNYICTKRLARRLYPSLKSHRLQVMRDTFYLEVEGAAHSATGDVAVLRELFKKMTNDFRADGVADVDILGTMIKTSVY